MTDFTKTDRSSDQFLLRLPDGMRARLKSAASENGRTLNAEIVLRLEQSELASSHRQQGAVPEFEHRLGHLLKTHRDEISRDLIGLRNSIEEIKSK